MRMLRRNARILVLAFAVVAMPCFPWLAATAHTHDPGLSSSLVVVSEGAAEATLRIHENDLAAAGEVSAADVLVLLSGGSDVRAMHAERTREADGDAVFSLTFQLPPDAEPEIRVPLLERLARGHKHVLEVRGADRRLITSALLSAQGSVPDIQGTVPVLGTSHATTEASEGTVPALQAPDQQSPR
jgi:hypothetical protein